MTDLHNVDPITTGSLDGPLAKWARADANLARLKTEIESVWPPHRLWPVRGERGPDGVEHRFYVGELPPIEPEWAIAVGEILFNLRSALDHLAYQLHVRRHGGNVPRKIEEKSQFPIYGRCSTWKSNLHRIETLCARDIRALHDLQPFVTHDDDSEQRRYWLGRLNAWHNVDKHRKLHLVTGAKNASVVPPEPALLTQTNYGAVHAGAHVETWTFSGPPEELPPHLGVFLHVALAHDGQSTDLVSVALPAITRRVREVLDSFADRFLGAST